MSKTKDFVNFFIEIAQLVAISLAIIIPIRMFVVQPFFVKGASMEPTFQDGEYLIVDEISYRFNEPVRGEVIIFRFPDDPSQYYIKRIIGLPGETVQVRNGEVTVFNEENPEGLLLTEQYLSTGFTNGDVTLTLDDDRFFVMGDNREKSYDSRRWGDLDEDLIIGRAVLRAWPFDQFATFDLPSY